MPQITRRGVIPEGQAAAREVLQRDPYCGRDAEEEDPPAPEGIAEGEKYTAIKSQVPGQPEQGAHAGGVVEELLHGGSLAVRDDGLLGTKKGALRQGDFGDSGTKKGSKKPEDRSH